MCFDNARFMNHADDPNIVDTYESFPKGGADRAAGFMMEQNQRLAA